MSANIVLPPLPNWAKENLAALYKATDRNGLDDAFDAFVAANTDSIVVNGHKLTRGQYKEYILGEKFRERNADVKYLGVVSVTSDSKHSDKVGEVGMFLHATIVDNVKFGADNLSLAVTLSINLVVIEDPALTPPEGPFRGGAFDRRRVVSLTAVSTSHPNGSLLPLPSPSAGNPGGPIKPPTA